MIEASPKICKFCTTEGRCGAHKKVVRALEEFGIESRGGKRYSVNIVSGELGQEYRLCPYTNGGIINKFTAQDQFVNCPGYNFDRGRLPYLKKITEEDKGQMREGIKAYKDERRIQFEALDQWLGRNSFKASNANISLPGR